MIECSNVLIPDILRVRYDMIRYPYPETHPAYARPTSHTG